MALITWTDDWSVGIAELDEQHQQLVGMVNDLHEAMSKGQAKSALEQLFSGLAQYVLTHFAAEEERMRERNYADFTEHKAAHDEFAQRVKNLQARFSRGESMISIEIMRFLKDWISDHVQGMDKKYEDALK